MSSDNLVSMRNLKSVFHLYSVLAVVVFAVLVVVVWNRTDKLHAWARLPSWLGNSTVLGLLVLVALFLAGFQTSLASMVTIRDGRLPMGLSVMSHRVSVGGLFLVAGALLVVVAVLIYRTYDFLFAFWLLVVTLVGLLVHFWLVWKARRAAAYLSVPLICLVLVGLYYVWNMVDQSADLDGNYNVCSVVYKSSLA